jgi:energy-coupling factor transporter ATP-binding protein EcfA2
MKPTERQQFTQIREQFFTGRAIFLLGPRDGGKQAFLNAMTTRMFRNVLADLRKKPGK